MIFQTKYDIGEEVWFISRNHACRGVVDNICIKLTDKGMEVCHYHIKSAAMENGKTVRTEDYIFGSREELVRSINEL